MDGDITSAKNIPPLIITINKKIHSAMKEINDRNNYKPIVIDLTREEKTLICNSHILKEYAEGLTDLLANIRPYKQDGSIKEKGRMPLDMIKKGEDSSFAGHVLLTGMSPKDRNSSTQIIDDSTIFGSKVLNKFMFHDSLEKDYTHFPMLFDEQMMKDRGDKTVIDYAYMTKDFMNYGLLDRGYKNGYTTNDLGSLPGYPDYTDIKFDKLNKENRHIRIEIANKINNYKRAGRWYYKPKQVEFYYTSIECSSRYGNHFTPTKGDYKSSNFHMAKLSVNKHYKHTFTDYKYYQVHMTFTDKQFLVPGKVDEVRAIETLTIIPDKSLNFSSEKKVRTNFYCQYQWGNDIPIEGINGRFREQWYKPSSNFRDTGGVCPYVQWVLNDRTMDYPQRPDLVDPIRKVTPAGSKGHEHITSAGHFQRVLDNTDENNKYGSLVFLALRARFDIYVHKQFHINHVKMESPTKEEKKKWSKQQFLLDHMTDRTMDKLDYFDKLVPEFSKMGRKFALKMIKTLIRKYINSFSFIVDRFARPGLTIPSLEESLKGDVLNITLLFTFLSMNDTLHSDNYFFFYKKKVDGISEEDLVRLDAQRNRESVLVTKKFRRDAMDIIEMDNIDKFTILVSMMSKLYTFKEIMQDAGLDRFEYCLPIKRIFNSIQFDNRISVLPKQNDADDGSVEHKVSFRDFDVIERNIKFVMNDMKDSLNPKTIVLSTIQQKLKLPQMIKDKLDTRLGELEVDPDSEVNGQNLEGRLDFLQSPNKEKVTNLNLRQKCSILAVLQDIESNVNKDDNIDESKKKEILSSIHSNYYSILRESLIQQDNVSAKEEEDDGSDAVKALLKTSGHMNNIIRLFKTKRSNEASKIFLVQYGTIKRNLQRTEDIKKDIKGRLSNRLDLEVDNEDYAYEEIDKSISEKFVNRQVVEKKATNVKTSLYWVATAGLAASALLNKLNKGKGK